MWIPFDCINITLQLKEESQVIANVSSKKVSNRPMFLLDSHSNEPIRTKLSKKHSKPPNSTKTSWSTKTHSQESSFFPSHWVGEINDQGNRVAVKNPKHKNKTLTYDKYFQDFEIRSKFTRNCDLPPPTSSVSGTVQLGVEGSGGWGGEGRDRYCIIALFK